MCDTKASVSLRTQNSIAAFIALEKVCLSSMTLSNKTTGTKWSNRECQKPLLGIHIGKTFACDLCCTPTLHLVHKGGGQPKFIQYLYMNESIEFYHEKYNLVHKGGGQPKFIQYLYMNESIEFYHEKYNCSMPKLTILPGFRAIGQKGQGHQVFEKLQNKRRLLSLAFLCFQTVQIHVSLILHLFGPRS